ncbi:MAG: formimidoylglutamase [Chlamydiae bacterium CG10_big_fil_rev_8_21_14_0_10_42_34]|nr:MAG: formimidoylglutamase [Chlamydiae bacterium CG10_big_fil_rev_8_21_14_0_10_42_34]
MLTELQTWMKFYSPPKKSDWTGRVDKDVSQRFHEIIICHDLTEKMPEQLSAFSRIGFVAFCCDEGVLRNQGRIGAASGPSAFRTAFGPLPHHLSSSTKVYDFGSIVCEEDDLEGAQEALGKVVAILVQNGIFPVLIGGGHEIAWGHFQGLRSAYPSSSISVVNFDAHFDLREVVDQKGTSGTSFTQIEQDNRKRDLPFDYLCLGIQKTGNTEALFSKAKELNVQYSPAEDFFFNQQKVTKQLDEWIKRSEKIYCSICLDVFGSFAAPGVSAPQPFGVHPWQIMPPLLALIRSKKLIALDIAELNPFFDFDHMTAKLAAHLVANLLIEIPAKNAL